MSGMHNWRNVSVSAAGLFALCGAAMGQAYSTGFEPPTFTGSASGTLLTNGAVGVPTIDGWYLPVACQDSAIFTYAGNTLSVAANSLGQTQFVGGIATTNFIRAQRSINFSSGGMWQMEYDVYGKWTAALPAVDNIGSVSLQPSATARFLQTLECWGSTPVGTPPNTVATNWTATADHFHIAIGHFNSTTVSGAALFDTPTNAWRDLPPEHWYRVKVRWNFDNATILWASLQDLTAGTPAVETDVSGNGWWLQGGPAGTNALPTDFRLFVGAGGGTSFGTLCVYDNVSVHPFAASTCYANCDGSTAVPFLNITDFTCFQSAFAAGSSYANCDNSTTPPVLNVNDFICFQGLFAAGCSAP
jgi:hypothetical protein